MFVIVQGLLSQRVVTQGYGGAATAAAHTFTAPARSPSLTAPIRSTTFTARAQ